MIDIQIPFWEKFGKYHFKQKDQRAAINARAVGGIHGDGNDNVIRHQRERSAREFGY